LYRSIINKEERETLPNNKFILNNFDTVTKQLEGRMKVELNEISKFSGDF